MIKAVIFDFDGVILESVDIKTQAFQMLFQTYPQHLEKIIGYHLDHGGVSRQEKIKYFYEKIIKEPLSASKLNDLCEQFQRLVLEQVITSSFVKGAQELLKNLKNHLKMYVISGTPQDEVRLIVKRRELDSYFDGVYGSPAKKGDLVREVLKQGKFQSKEVVFVGDAITDLEASKQNGIYFIARVKDSKETWYKDSAVNFVSKDLTEVEQFIDFLNKK